MSVHCPEFITFYPMYKINFLIHFCRFFLCFFLAVKMQNVLSFVSWHTVLDRLKGLNRRLVVFSAVQTVQGIPLMTPAACCFLWFVPICGLGARAAFLNQWYLS